MFQLSILGEFLVMSTQMLKTREGADKLSPIERIELIEHLYYSLNSKPNRERIDFLWETESEKRLSAYEFGEMKSVPLSDVLQKWSLPAHD